MKDNRTKLYEIAEGQRGFFTTKQARSCGYVSANHPYHVRTGAWVREHRGVYRLSAFPRSPEDQYVLWSLWSRGRDDRPVGVYSHQTALSLYELSDVMPSKLHMTVPPGFRRNTDIPKVSAPVENASKVTGLKTASAAGAGLAGSRAVRFFLSSGSWSLRSGRSRHGAGGGRARRRPGWSRC